MDELQTKVSGWKEICSATGLEPTQWRKLHRRAVRGELPIFYDTFGKPVACREKLRAAMNVVTTAAEHSSVRKAHGAPVGDSRAA